MCTLSVLCTCIYPLYYMVTGAPPTCSCYWPMFSYLLPCVYMHLSGRMWCVAVRSNNFTMYVHVLASRVSHFTASPGTRNATCAVCTYMYTVQLIDVGLLSELVDLYGMVLTCPLALIHM